MAGETIEVDNSEQSGPKIPESQSARGIARHSRPVYRSSKVSSRLFPQLTTLGLSLFSAENKEGFKKMLLSPFRVSHSLIQPID